jgi:hypothetical protein
MSDTPTPPAGGAEGGAADGAGAETPWYSKPTTWVVFVLLLAAVVAVFVLSSDDDDSSDVATPSSSSTTSSSTSSTTPSSSTTSTSTSTPEGTTTSTTEGTDTGDTPGATPVAITESEVKGVLAYYTGSEGQVPFEDGGVEANWYTWDDQFVVAYAGWDATTGDPQCPGNSLENLGAFDYISNSPSGDGGCDPEDAFPNLVSGDEGARVCEGLVLYRTIIPVEGDDGTPTAGTLYGSIEQAVEGDYVGATSMAPIDSGAVEELDFTADAYTVPDGWLADGKTEVTC